ncbi:MAG TPA: hypothetical protein VEB22_14925 [Phycisphaerales bacterium]|nr:hypothetical protein [Phycisphaerales bacterium]
MDAVAETRAFLEGQLSRLAEETARIRRALDALSEPGQFAAPALEDLMGTSPVEFTLRDAVQQALVEMPPREFTTAELRLFISNRYPHLEYTLGTGVLAKLVSRAAGASDGKLVVVAQGKGKRPAIYRKRASL